MRVFFRGFLKNLATCFSGRYLLAHASLIAITVLAVRTGADWRWYQTFKDVPRMWLFPGVALGGLLPMLVPFVLLGIATLRKDLSLARTTGAVGQSALLGMLVSGGYKALTGRAHPSFDLVLTHDITRDFQFGFWKAGVFWGWPSTHTTVAFATAVALAVLYRRVPIVKWPVLLYALYVGLAVSVSIHWLSDFLAGAIAGTVIGLVVGRSFMTEPPAQPSPTPAVT